MHLIIFQTSSKNPDPKINFKVHSAPSFKARVDEKDWLKDLFWCSFTLGGLVTLGGGGDAKVL